MSLSSSAMDGATRIGNHGPNQRVKLWKVGKKAVKFKMWHMTRLNTGDGKDCGPFYQVTELPVSERHNGAEGIGQDQHGNITTQPDFWRRIGWTDFAEIPDEWREVNAKAWEKHREFDAERADTPQAKALRASIEGQSASAAQIAQAVQALVDQTHAAKANKLGGKGG